MEGGKQLPLKKKRGLVISILVFILFFIGIVGSSVIYIQSALKPVDEDANKEIHVSIPIGSSVIEIAKILEKKGVIKNALVFRYYVKLKNETGFQAGDYVLTTAMDVPEIIAKLKEGKVKKQAALKITIPEGIRVVDIAEIIASKTAYSQKEVLQQMQDQAFIQTLAASFPMLKLEDILRQGIKYSLEGYLFPATYEFDEKNPPLDIMITAMVEKMQTVVNKYERDIQKSGYSIHEILTLASLIETETQKSEDRYKVSGVFHNRLKRDMRLDSDPTVKYALDKTDIQVTHKDTTVSSPYNTYRIKGIPIGPIASPREESIRAALHPKQVDELYFFARPNGQIIYTKTLTEHEKVVTAYRHEWRELIEKQKQEKRERQN